MSYTDEEIQKYLNIMESYNHPSPIKTNKVTCNHCNNTEFINDKGYRYCNKCGYSIGHILGYNDLTEIDRCHFHQKSIYKRKYHYQNKIEGVNTKFNLNLTSDDKYELFKKLRKIDDKMTKKLMKNGKEKG